VEEMSAKPEADKLIAGAVPSIEEITGSRRKTSIKTGMEGVLRRVELVDRRTSDGFDVLGREIRIQCPTKTMNYISYLSARDAGVLQQKIPVDLGTPRRVSIKAKGVSPPNAIQMIENGFTIDMTALKQEQEYLLEVEYAIDDPKFLEDLVLRKDPTESAAEDKKEYWMFAELKSLEDLKTKYGEIDLRDMDFFVNVDVHQDVDTTIPKPFRDRLESITALTRTADVNEKFREWSKIRSTNFGRSGKGDLDTLEDVFRLFAPDHFKSYVSVSKPFDYYDSEQGTNLLDFPLISIPKFMRVISRVDLSRDNPTAEGTLTFKRRNMLDEITDLFK
jgi:hypothetical protein